MLPEQVCEAFTAAADGLDPADVTWEELKPRLLDHLGMASEQDDPLVYQMVYTIEQSSDSDRRELIGSPDRFNAMAYESAAAVEPPAVDAVAEPAAGDTPTSADPHWDGEKWLTYDTAAEQWVPMEGDNVEAAADQELMGRKAYEETLLRLREEDPELAAKLESDPELLRQLYEQAIAEFGA